MWWRIVMVCALVAVAEPGLACEAHGEGTQEEAMLGEAPLFASDAVVAAARRYEAPLKDPKALSWHKLLAATFPEEQAPLPEGEGLDALAGSGPRHCTSDMMEAMPRLRVTRADPAIEAVHATGQQVRGYVYTTGAGTQSRHFLLGPYPKGCKECPEFPTEYAVEVMTPVAVALPEGPVTLTGYFEIIRDIGEFHYAYRMIGAELVGAGQ